MKIYTRRGDDGETDLFGGVGGMHRVPKNSHRIEAIGGVDELNACIGVVLAGACEDRVRELLLEIQKDLFVLGADFATPEVVAVRGESDVPRVNEKRISELEMVIDELQGELDSGVGVMMSFILPGGCEVAAGLHVCRSVCRRAERVCVGLAEDEDSDAGNGGHRGAEKSAPVRRGARGAHGVRLLVCIKFLNRLSDLLFVMARWENMKKGVEEVKWRGQT